MIIARINITAITNYLHEHDTAPGTSWRWHDRRERVAAAVGPEKLVVVDDASGSRILHALDGEWSVRNPPPGSYRLLTDAEVLSLDNSI